MGLHRGTVRSVYDKKFKSNHGQHDFKVVETQSPIKPGDSGGPVVNEEGKLVAIAQSFSPQMNLVSYCVDVSEIQSVPGQPLETCSAGDQARFGQRRNRAQGSRHGALPGRPRALGRKDPIGFRGQGYGVLPAGRCAKDLVAGIGHQRRAQRRADDATDAAELGHQDRWLGVEKNSSDEFMVIYVAKLDATAPDEAVKATIDYVARIANAMSTRTHRQEG